MNKVKSVWICYAKYLQVPMWLVNITQIQQNIRIYHTTKRYKKQEEEKTELRFHLDKLNFCIFFFRLLRPVLNEIN